MIRPRLFYEGNNFDGTLFSFPKSAILSRFRNPVRFVLPPADLISKYGKIFKIEQTFAVVWVMSVHFSKEVTTKRHILTFVPDVSYLGISYAYYFSGQHLGNVS